MLTLKAKMLLLSYNNEHTKNADTGKISHEMRMRLIIGPEYIWHAIICC